METPKSAQQALGQALRLERARAIVDEMRRGGDYLLYNVTAHGAMDLYKRGFNGAKDAWYRIDLIHETCTCPDHADSGHFCKHLLACSIFCAELADEENCNHLIALHENAEVDGGCDPYSRY